jgi:SAM-dependent methyltransferase
MTGVAEVRAHYAGLLAPLYLWMAGGIEHATRLGADDVSAFLGTRGVAVDLGAGFGMHTIPLARRGWRVLALDSSEHLLSELRLQCQGLDVEAALDDLTNFRAHLQGHADLVLCMGDTLTHLADPDQVQLLMREVRRALRPGGQFVATWRDYRSLPAGPDRFIPVRSDANRILTCFLEEAGSRVQVHDVLHERHGEKWTMKVSSYAKLRLSREDVLEAADAAGLSASVEAGPRGMLRLRASA